MRGGGGVLLILIRVSARCHFHKSLNWARLVHYPLFPQEQIKIISQTIIYCWFDDNYSSCNSHEIIVTMVTLMNNK